jgi:hypothetical protein
MFMCEIPWQNHLNNEYTLTKMKARKCKTGPVRGWRLASGRGRE